LKFKAILLIEMILIDI